ncbi:MAG: hypothetical protein RIC81_05800 [Microcella pacifica]|uniref:Uncharacterized protein n=1 Tax=Microcella pacifica TaxID=2591847 RepID=A0A9E5JPR9_9MICO|nr:hypothetical protein [Microcella pacifica]NHF63564.1 hypothetical protein [Microcella pacifica]
MTPEQCFAFLEKWAKRSQLKWSELATHSRHGLGSEKIPSHKIKPSIPEPLRQDDYKVLRHESNLPMVGIQAGDILYVLWIECNYGDLYDH